MIYRQTTLFNVADRVERVTQGDGSYSLVTRDALGRSRAVATFESGGQGTQVSTVTYDLGGVVTQTTQGENVTNIVADALGRPLTITIQRGSQIASHSTHSSTLGGSQSSSGVNGTIQATFDPLGQVLGSTSRDTDLAIAGSWTNSYNTVGQLIGSVSGAVVSAYSYLHDGLEQIVTQSIGGVQSMVSQVVRAIADGPATTTDGTGNTSVTTLDAAGNVQSESLHNAMCAGPNSGRNYCRINAEWKLGS